jgi:hypothetical protein
MYENVNKAHPYIEKELEGIDTYDRVILYGKAGRSMAIERPFILDEPVTTGNMSEYEVKEIRPLLFQITKGGSKWLVGSKNYACGCRAALQNFPRPDRGLRTSKGNRPLWVHSEVENTVVSNDLILTKSNGNRVEIRTEDRLVTIQVGYKFSTVLFWESRKLVKKEEIGDLNTALYMAAKFLGKPVYHHLFVVCP